MKYVCMLVGNNEDSYPYVVNQSNGPVHPAWVRVIPGR